METSTFEGRTVAEGITIHEEELVDLLARAFATEKFPDLAFDDPTARAMIDVLDVDSARFDLGRLRSSLATTIVIDAVVRSFFDRHPDGLAIGVNQSLCTRFSRIDNGSLRWIDVDLPPIASFKSSLLPVNDRHCIGTCCSMRCDGWLRCLREARDVPTIIVAQGTLRRSSPEELDAFFVSAGECAGEGTELVLDYDARSPLRPSSLKTASASLESPTAEGGVARYPRLRFVSSEEYPAGLEHAVSGMNGVSRLFRGRGVASLAHLRFR